MSVTSHTSHNNKVDKIFTIAILVLFAVVLFMSFSLSRVAGGVPKLISIAGIILSIITLFAKPKQKGGNAETENTSVNENQGMRFMKSFGMILVYLVGMIVLGFIISTLAMMFSMTLLLGYKNHKMNVLISLVTTTVLYVSFQYLFYVRLPIGYVFNLFR